MSEPVPELLMYTVYRHPADMPGVVWAVRQWSTSQDGPVAGPVLGTADDLQAARKLVPPEADMCVPRAPVDDPAVFETWL